jgi:hypothetical protein
MNRDVKMMFATVPGVTPAIDESEARTRLNQQARQGWWPFRKIPPVWTRLQRVSLPFYWFVIQAREQKIAMGIEAIKGNVLYMNHELLLESTPPEGVLADPCLTPVQAEDLADQVVQGLFLQYGAFHRSKFRNATIVDRVYRYYPVWIGYYKRRGSYDFKALDAVSGEQLGLVFRHVLVTVLMQT